MHIIFNTSILHSPKTGIGNYIAELILALQKHHTVQITAFNGRSVSPIPRPQHPKIKGQMRNLFRQLPGAYQFRRYREQRAFDFAVQQSQPTLYHDPSLWPLQFAGPTAMTVHDLTHINYAQTQPRARVREIERQLPSALERAKRILVDSQFIARELQQHYNVSPKKIVVAPLAHSQDFGPRRKTQLGGTLLRFQLNYQRYFLFVGTLEPRKNLTLALRAHAALPASIREQFPLIVAGGDGWLTRDIESQLTKAAARGHVRQLGYIDRDDLADILAGAKAFIFPSLYEGFGIPVLEAMASGVPVISSNAASLPEVGGDAARYIDPNDEAELTHLMLELIEDEAECKRLNAAGIERAKQYSWEKCAAITIDAYRAALAEH